MHKYSIIIPSLNEEKFLPKILKHLQKFTEDFEIILSDGGSTDNTVNIAKSFGVKICLGENGKGGQLNRAAKISSGKVLIFLHADTYLPADAFYLIDKFFFNDNINIATFKMKFDSENLIMRMYSWFTKFDSIFTTFGDQAIVMKRSFFSEIGGFPNFPMFEDVEFFRRARKIKKIYKLPSFVTTSARRYERKGVVKTQLLNGFYILGYLIGINPVRIYRKYFKESSL